MSTKDELLKFFEENKGTYLSGEQIADRLDISRTAVWKAVNSLREDGYEIDAQKTRGYCLSEASDIVSAQGVSKYLEQELNVVVFDEVDSTNTLLKKMASEGAVEGTVVIANSQTGGKGRLGRSFFSPMETGVYISVLLRPTDIQPSKALKITTMAAVAAAETIDEVSGKTALIKWVNDVFVEGLKCVGILTEASVSMESGNLEYAVLGIGFNVYQPKGGFPKELKGIAGSIFDESVPDAKNKIAAGFLNRFMAIYRSPDLLNYEKKYKDKSLVLGRKVNVISPVETRVAEVLDITSDCGLLVKFDDGHEEVLSSGEVSIRPR